MSDIFARFQLNLDFLEQIFVKSPEYQNSGKICPVGGALMLLSS